MVYPQHKQMRQNKHRINFLSNQYVNKLQLRTGAKMFDPEHGAARHITAAHGERRDSLEETPSHHLLVGNPMRFVIDRQEACRQRLLQDTTPSPALACKKYFSAGAGGSHP